LMLAICEAAVCRVSYMPSIYDPQLNGYIHYTDRLNTSSTVICHQFLLELVVVPHDDIAWWLSKEKTRFI
jgi:hypothetical protein